MRVTLAAATTVVTLAALAVATSAAAVPYLQVGSTIAVPNATASNSVTSLSPSAGGRYFEFTFAGPGTFSFDSVTNPSASTSFTFATGTWSSGAVASSYFTSPKYNGIDTYAVTASTVLFVDIAGGAVAAGKTFSANYSFTPPPAAPEPATWLMMMVGLGGVGFALRRRNTQAFA